MLYPSFLSGPAVLVYLQLNFEHDSRLSLLVTIKFHHCHARRRFESHYLVPHARFYANVFIPDILCVSCAGGHAAQSGITLDGSAIHGTHTTWVQ